MTLHEVKPSWARKRRERAIESAASELQSLARDIEREQTAALDLWTWLPSHRAAVKSHGDYASEFAPAPADVMKEACMLLALMNGHNPTNEGELFGYAEWFGCPCGECGQSVVQKDKLEKMIKFTGRYIKAHGIVMGLALWDKAGRVDKDELELHCGMASAYYQMIEDHDDDKS